MIEAVPKHIFSNDYRLYHQDRLVVELQVSAWREGAQMEIDDTPYRFYREGFVRGAFLLEKDGHVLARAVKPSAFRNRFEIDVAGIPFTLRKHSMWSRRFHLFQAGRQVGTIAPASFFTHRAHIGLPEAWPVAVQVFVFWLSLIIWNRESAVE